MQIENISIEKLKPYENNAKEHPQDQIEKVANSIKEFGFRQPIVVDENMVVIVGHGRLLAAQHLGIKDVPVHIADLSEEQAMAYRLADNKLNESDWNMDLVSDELKLLKDMDFDISLTGFEIDLIIEPEEKDDVISEPPEEPKAKLGDIYQLGEHRLMCGDCTDLGKVEELMDGALADCVVTDPPYNTGMTPQTQEGTGGLWKGKKKPGEKAWLSHMFNDSYTDEEWDCFVKDFFTSYDVYTKGECAFYVFIDWRRVNDIRVPMEEIMDVKNVIVWDKVVHGLGSDYKYTYELCVVGKKGKPEINNRFGKDYQDIWRVQRAMGKNDSHATAKPVELIEKPIKHASKQDDIILDFFGGSGTTMIAAEKLNRKCYMMELEPKYIDVIVKRWENYTGEKAIKLN